MRAACFREDRAHTQVTSRVALTGRKTLSRVFTKAEAEALPSLGEVTDTRIQVWCDEAKSAQTK